MLRKLEKLSRILRSRLLVRGLAYGVPATTEHLDILAYMRPRHLIDVGANKGQFALAALSVDPAIAIDCFEPYEAPLSVLRTWAKAIAPRLRVHPLALAASAGEAPFHVTGREDGSSLFHPSNKGEGREATPSESTVVKSTITVQTARLDDCIGAGEVQRPCLLKLDVQGGELGVLLGAERILQAVDYIYIEVSFVEAYENQPLFQDVDDFLRARGFRLRGVVNAYSSPKYGPVQSDALYTRA